MKTPEIQARLHKYDEFKQYLEDVTGEDTSTMRGIASLYNNLRAGVSLIILISENKSY